MRYQKCACLGICVLHDTEHHDLEKPLVHVTRGQTEDVDDVIVVTFASLGLVGVAATAAKGRSDFTPQSVVFVLTAPDVGLKELFVFLLGNLQLDDGTLERKRGLLLIGSQEYGCILVMRSHLE